MGSMVKFAPPFWDRVDKSGDCWTWTAGTTAFGYGRVNGLPYTGRQSALLTHRVSWFLTYGEWPAAGMCVLHRCDNPPCVRPDHLFLGTKKDNTQDMVQKGRGKAGAQPFGSRTHGTRNAHAKLNEAQVVEMRQRAAGGEHYRDLAVEYGISATRCNGIINGQGWRHVWPFDQPDAPSREIRRRVRKRPDE
jgi:hypothetical protein